MLENKELHAIFSGLVQGVGFRFTALTLAKELGLVGTVSNLPDGRVELFAQGEVYCLNHLLYELQGPAGPGRVDHVQVTFSLISHPKRDFKVI